MRMQQDNRGGRSLLSRPRVSSEEAAGSGATSSKKGLDFSAAELEISKKSGSLIQTPNSRVLIPRTPTERKAN